MLIKLNFVADIPIYQQLKNQIILGIAKKDLTPLESLPSVRELAGDLGVNLHTVRKAYNQLKAEGFLHVNRRKGATVAELPINIDSNQKEFINDQLNIIIATLICNGKSSDEIKLIVSKKLDQLIERK